jgi:hypothetical protein
LKPSRTNAQPACGRYVLRTGAAGSQDESPCRRFTSGAPTTPEYIHQLICDQFLENKSMSCADAKFLRR